MTNKITHKEILNENVEDRIKEFIAAKTLSSCYWGHLFSRIRRRSNSNLPSVMGVRLEKDATITLEYNPDIVRKVNNDCLLKLLEHEGMHLINMHISRLIKILSEELNDKCKSIKSTVWNIAADCCVNESIHLKEIEIDKKLFPACLPELYNLPKNYSSEFYYYELLKNRKIKFFTESPNSHEGWISEIKSIEDLLSLARKTDSFTKDIIKESVKNFNKSRGHLPCGLEELIKEALKPPQLPYYQIIRKLVKASRFSKYRRSFTKLNRKRTYLFCIGDKNIPQLCPFPGKTKDFTFRISILLDTSGSMSLENVLEGLSGIRDIIEKDRNCFVNIIECDAKVQKEYQVKKLRDIQMGICGRGGTTLFPGLERCKELDSDIVLVFTDGFCDNINEIPKRLLPKKIVWVLTKNGSDNDINKTGVIVRLKK